MKGRDRTKLPRWAQNELDRLERDLEHYKNVVATGPEDSNTFAEPYSDTPRPLGKDTMVEFHLGDCRVRAHVVRGQLHINGDEPLAVRPRASNAVEIEAVRR